MVDPRSHQCRRGRSLILWRGRQWSVTSAGIETTDPSTPHIVIRADDLDSVQRVKDGTFTPLLPRNATWFDEEDFSAAVARAHTIHFRRSGATHSPRNARAGNGAAGEI